MQEYPSIGVNSATIRMYVCHEGEEGPKSLPWAMSSYVSNKCSERSPPFHLNAEGSTELDQYRITPTLITINTAFISRGLGGKNVAQYDITSWNEVTINT